GPSVQPRPGSFLWREFLRFTLRWISAAEPVLTVRGLNISTRTRARGIVRRLRRDTHLRYFLAVGEALKMPASAVLEKRARDHPFDAISAGSHYPVSYRRPGSSHHERFL